LNPSSLSEKSYGSTRDRIRALQRLGIKLHIYRAISCTPALKQRCACPIVEVPSLRIPVKTNDQASVRRDRHAFVQGFRQRCRFVMRISTKKSLAVWQLQSIKNAREKLVGLSSVR
jgi:hypothetical protein